jgi:thioredoxin 1
MKNKVMHFIITLSTVILLTSLLASFSSGVEKKPVKALASPAPQTIARLLDLGATKCIPCKMMAPILEELRKEYAGSLQVEFIDVKENPEEGRRYQIRGIPTQIFYDTMGMERRRHEGFISKEDILTVFKELNIDIRKISR